jgi:hypothetical protein
MIETMLAAGHFNLSFISFFARQDQIEDSMCDASSKVRDALSQPRIPHGEKRHEVQNDDAVFGSAVKGVAF